MPLSNHHLKPERKSPWESPLFWSLALGALSYGAWTRSFWADEFHSLHHAQCSSLGELLGSVRTDNHPPLSFLLEQLSIGWLGSTEFALRLPSLLVGLTFLAMLRRSISELAPWPGSRLAPWLALASSYYFVVFSEGRMYALLALATLGLMLALRRLLAEEPRRSSAWWLSLWIVIGLHSHYYFIHELIISALFLGLLWMQQPGMRKNYRRLMLPGCLGIALFAPWGFYGFWVQLLGELPPGRAAGDLGTLRDGFAHMFHWNASLGGSWAVYLVAIPGTVLAALAGLLGMGRVLPCLREQGPRGMQALMLLCFGVGLPIFTWTISRFSERSSFGWRYLAGAAISILIIAALGLAGTSALRRLLRASLLMTMGIITCVNLTSGGHEDHRKLFAHIMTHGLPTDAVLDKPPYDPQPKPEESSWRFYVNRFDQASNPTLPTEFHYDEISKAQQRSRVWVWFRDQYHPWIRRELRRSHDIEEQWQMGPALSLHLFSKSTPPATQ